MTLGQETRWAYSTMIPDLGTETHTATEGDGVDWQYKRLRAAGKGAKWRNKVQNKVKY